MCEDDEWDEKKNIYLYILCGLLGFCGDREYLIRTLARKNRRHNNTDDNGRTSQINASDENK